MNGIYIIFTPEQREDYAGRYGKYSELNPVELKTGEFAVGIEVLSDKNFSDIKDELQLLPQKELFQEDFKNYIA